MRGWLRAVDVPLVRGDLIRPGPYLMSVHLLCISMDTSERGGVHWSKWSTVKLASKKPFQITSQRTRGRKTSQDFILS